MDVNGSLRNPGTRKGLSSAGNADRCVHSWRDGLLVLWQVIEDARGQRAVLGLASS
jgi:hypothetical protein